MIKPTSKPGIANGAGPPKRSLFGCNGLLCHGKKKHVKEATVAAENLAIKSWRSWNLLRIPGSSVNHWLDLQYVAHLLPNQDILWIDEILHHVETMGNHCALVFTRDKSFQGFLGGAGFRPSTVSGCQGLLAGHRILDSEGSLDSFRGPCWKVSLACLGSPCSNLS